jgi:hypothetical protein
VGANWLPSDMVAQVHEGERIIPAADNRALIEAMRNPNRSSDVLLAEMRELRKSNEALRREVERMRLENNEGHAANAAATEAGADKVSGGINRAGHAAALAQKSKVR